MIKKLENTMSMQTLKSIEKSFNNLSLRFKIEFFLFPLIIIAVYLFLYKGNAQEKNIKHLNIKEEVLNQKMNENILEILENIEKYIKEKEIKVINVSNKEKEINIKINSNTQKQLQFINFLENYNSFSSIKTLKINKDILDVDIQFSRFFFKVGSNFKNDIEFFKSHEISNKFSLLAIIDDQVFINNKWLKKGDKIGEYKLIKIKKEKIVVKKEKKIFSIGLFKNENL